MNYCGKYKIKDIKDGMSFIAKINKSNCAGRITIGRYGEIFFCQNYEDGNYCSDRKGFKYSWQFEPYGVSDLIIHELELPGPFKMNTEPIDLDEELLLL